MLGTSENLMRKSQEIQALLYLQQVHCEDTTYSKRGKKGKTKVFLLEKLKSWLFYFSIHLPIQGCQRCWGQSQRPSGERHENTLDRAPVQRRSHTYSEQFCVSLAENMHRKNPDQELNPGPFCCEATTASPCHPNSSLKVKKKNP